MKSFIKGCPIVNECSILHFLGKTTMSTMPTTIPTTMPTAPPLEIIRNKKTPFFSRKKDLSPSFFNRKKDLPPSYKEAISN